MTNLYSELDQDAEPVGTPRRSLSIGAHPDDDVKVEALLWHSSQSQTTMGDATSDDQAREQFEDQLRDWASRDAEETAYSLAESFKLIRP